MEIEQYLEILSKNTPFDGFVSTRFEPDSLDLNVIRDSLDQDIINVLKNMEIQKKSQIVSIIGESGSGKTHFYWVLNDFLNKKACDFHIAYISPPEIKDKDIYFSFYKNFISELGEKSLNKVSSKVIALAGGKTSNLDLLGLIKVKKPTKSIIKDIFQKTEYSEFEQNLMTIFIFLGSGTPSERETALKWLKNEPLKSKDFKKFGVKPNEFTDVEYIKIINTIISYLGKPLILFFDDIEFYQMLDKEKELSQLIKDLYTGLDSALIILVSLIESWNYLNNLIETVLETEIKDVKRLENFTETNIQNFYSESMDKFWKENNLDTPSDPLFPLNNKILKIINLKSRGNPRLVKKMLKNAINQKLYETQVENLWELKEIINK